MLLLHVIETANKTSYFVIETLIVSITNSTYYLDMKLNKNWDLDKLIIVWL